MPTTLESQNSVILDSVADGVFTVDRTWKITSFNRAAERIIGIARNEAIGRKCWEVFHADVCEKECVMRTTLDSGRPCINRTVHIVNQDGRHIPISISTALLKNRKGTVVGGVETFRDLSEIEELRREITGRHTFWDIVTRDHRLIAMFNTLPAIARSDSPVLILGESGTGKELMARAIHHLSERKKGPFVPVNCGALPETLLESELFGYRKGAFTDAKSDKPGRFDRARGGTLFLDEISELPASVQVKLLRVIQERMFEPLGATEPVKSDVRIVAATNRDLERMIGDGRFRQDLYYRINVLPLELPPLRERRGDIPLLVEHFITHYNSVYRRQVQGLSQAALAALAEHDFPGNIRELENILQHAFIICPGTQIDTAHFPERFFRTPRSTPIAPAESSLQGFERRLIEQALQENRYNRTRTANRLGIHPSTLWRKMKKLGIDPL